MHTYVCGGAFERGKSAMKYVKTLYIRKTPSISIVYFTSSSLFSGFLSADSANPLPSYVPHSECVCKVKHIKISECEWNNEQRVLW